MKVMVIHGSPRKKGNSDALADAFCGALPGGSCEITRVHLNSLSVKGCQGCMSCKGRTEACVVRDDIAAPLAALPGTDILLLASPVYFGDVSAQMKAFIDRLYFLFLPNFEEGFDVETRRWNGKPVSRLRGRTSIVLATSQGAPWPDAHADIHTRYGEFFRWLGFQGVHSLRQLGDPAQGPENNMASACAEAAALARSLSAA